MNSYFLQRAQVPYNQVKRSYPVAQLDGWPFHFHSQQASQSYSQRATAIILCFVASSRSLPYINMRVS